jgi:signal peptidase I
LLREYALAALVAAAMALGVRFVVAEPFRIPSASMVPTLLVGDYVFVWKLAYGVRLPFIERPVIQLATPKRGEIVVFRHPREPDKDYVKRVVGLPGDVIEIREGSLYVNGVAQPREPDGQETYEEWSDRSGRWWSESCPRFLEQLAAGPVAPPRDGSPDAETESWSRASAGGVVRHRVLQCRRPRHGEQEGPFERVAPGHVFVLGDNRDRSQDSRASGGWQVPFYLLRGRASRVLLRWAPGEPGAAKVQRLFKPIE